MANVEPALSLKKISVSYGRHTVISDLSLDVEKGKTFGLMGLNGSGKTTLLKAILGLRSHDEGEISLGGLSVSHPQSKRHIAYLPERFDPPWFLKGLEFVRFSMRLYDAPFQKDDVFAVSEKLALDPSVLSARVQTYSKGMRQKLGFLATLMTACPFLILDEPMSGLDPMARVFVKNSLHQAKEEGRTVFMCSHILSDMNEVCDDVGVLHEGNLVFTGTPGALKKKGKDDNIEKAFLNVIAAAAAV